MRTLAAAVAVAAAMTMPVAQAGTVADPEVRDPAGDATWLHPGGVNADWADITGVWFGTLREGNESTGLRLHLGLQGDASAADRDAEFSLSWTMGTCLADLRVLRTDPGDVWGAAGATMSYGCAEDGADVSVAGLATVGTTPWMDPVSLITIDSGTQIVIDIPFAAFSQGAAAGRLRDGASIEGAHATSRVLATLRADGQILPVDDTGCPMVRTDDRPCAPRPYVVGA